MGAAGCHCRCGRRGRRGCWERQGGGCQSWGARPSQMELPAAVPGILCQCCITCFPGAVAVPSASTTHPLSWHRPAQQLRPCTEGPPCRHLLQASLGTETGTPRQCLSVLSGHGSNPASVRAAVVAHATERHWRTEPWITFPRPVCCRRIRLPWGGGCLCRSACQINGDVIHTAPRSPR